MMDAAEAERAGLVARVVPAADLLAEAITLANRIAALSPVAVRAAKQLVNQAFEVALAPGLRAERAGVPVAVRHRRPARGHGGVPRKASTGICGQPIRAGGFLTRPRGLLRTPASARLVPIPA